MLESSSKNTARMIVRDRQGREYRLQVDPDEDQYFTAKLLYRNSEVGRIQCVLYPPDKLVIGDILIRDDVIHAPEHLWADILRRLVEPKPIDYRRRGLGTHLLQFAVKKARQRGIKRICGSLTQKDINNNPNLVKWYKKHGFEIVPPSQENLKEAVLGISLDLGEKSN
ncbi:GNAT family N-acetyltransferase [Microcoleus sp. Pol7_A1]|uniref:GNAT family N-acetyltransferase n=1 Tax=Microcoleus sp. Pol7_A1 TaxID=2818893 RepID=UPI002FD00331